MLARFYTDNDRDGNARAIWCDVIEGVIVRTFHESAEGPRIPGASIEEIAGAPYRYVIPALWQSVRIGANVHHLRIMGGQQP